VRGILMIVGLAGCQLVFDVDSTVTPACREEGVELCLEFEDDLTDFESPDSSIRDNDAALVNVTSTERKGHGAATLAIDSEISIKNVNTLNFAGPLSVEAFLRWPGGGESLQGVVDNFEAYGIAINNSGSVFCSFFLDNSPFFSGAGTAFMPGLTIDVWHHVACVYDPEVGTTIYLDGMPRSTDADGAQNTVVTNRGGRVRVGSFDDGTSRFVGDVDDVRIVTRALKEAEIMATVNAD
jgi:hypothetical protein